MPRETRRGDAHVPTEDELDQTIADSMIASDPPSFGVDTGVGAPLDGEDLEERIRLHAYELWVHAGYPEGRAMEFWLRAEGEIAGPSAGG